MKKILSYVLMLIIPLLLALSPGETATAQTSCSAAINIVPDGACSGAFSLTDNAIETTGTPAPGCSAALNREYWLKFTISGGPRNVTITGTSSNRNQVIQVLSGSCGALTQIGCADANTTNGVQTETVNLTSLANGTYYIRIGNTTNNDMSMTNVCVTTSAPSCTHTIALTDTYGDGWNGGTITVTVNGTAVLSNITLASGSGPQNFTFSAATGDNINITRTADGTFPAEMRVEVIGGSSNTILSVQEPLTAPGLTVTACCAPTAPVSATYSSPANSSTGANVCGVALSWNAPTNSGCNSATSYDVYFGTSATPPLVGNTTATNYSTGTLAASTTYYWKIVPKNAVGSATGSATWSFTTSATPCTACTHTIRLTDSYGDGWNGGNVTVSVNGVPVLTNITLAGMTGPEDFTFAAADGAVINVTRTADGSYPAEMRVEILGTAGISLLSVQQPLTSPGTNVSGCCTPASPICATTPVPSNAVTGINPCSLDLSWTAPASSGCNKASSYDLYFGTTPSPAFYANVTGTTFTFPNALADNTTYYWKIVPKNVSGSATGCTTWSFTTSASPNPAYCLYGSAVNYPSGGTNCAQMTSESNNQMGCIWNRGTISFASSFDYTVNMYFGNNTGGADGCAFVFQNSSQGISACGNNGAQLGAGGIPNSVIIEFDTYDNDDPAHIYDIAVDHTAIEVDGNLQNGAPLCGPIQADPVDGFIDDGLMHALRVTWNPVTKQMCVYVDGSQRLCCNYDFIANVFGGNPNVYWGFTGATGALNNQQYFCPITIPVPIELAGYSASCSGGKPLLTWFTASEINNNYFYIERSEDGVSYEKIATVNGAGNSNHSIMYQFIDQQAGSKPYFYKLFQTDIDGKTTELGMVHSDCTYDESALRITTAYPTGAMGICVDFNTGLEGLHNIILCDIKGKIIEQTQQYCQKGFNQTDFVSNIKPGVYIIRIYNEISTTSIKIEF